MNAALSDYAKQNLDDFLHQIEPNLAAYQNAEFSYLAFKNGDSYELAQGRLVLGSSIVQRSLQLFRSKNIMAGTWMLSDMGYTPKSVVDCLLTGILKTPHGDLHFPPGHGNQYSVHFNPLHQDGVLKQNRLIHCNLSGNTRPRFDSRIIDWDLKAAAVPFESMLDLCNEFSIGAIIGDITNVDIVAFNVAAIGSASKIDGGKAKLALRLANNLNRDKASIGVRTIVNFNKTIDRKIISGSDLAWTTVDNAQEGTCEFDLQSGAVLHCIARYEEIAQHHAWLMDQKIAPNPFRAVHQAFDRELEVLNELIEKTKMKRADARDLELAVGWLLWMLGFSVTHIGYPKINSDAPDLIAATPQGNFLVIECTTGILKEDNKLAHLVERAEKVRHNLQVSGNGHMRVLPIIITTKTRDEVKADLEQATKLGVLVATKEDFPEAINLTLTFPDANNLYLRAETRLRQIQAPSTLAI